MPVLPCLRTSSNSNLIRSQNADRHARWPPCRKKKSWRSGTSGRRRALASSPSPRDEGLTAYYPFDGDLRMLRPRTTAKRCAAKWFTTTGPWAKAADFSGETQVDFGNAGDFDRDKPFALAFWVRPDRYQGRRNPAEARCQRTLAGMGDFARRQPAFEGFQRPKFTVFVRLANHWPDDAIEVQTKERVLMTYSRAICC